MDPNTNVTPGVVPAAAPAEPVIPNPAVDVANAALAGATPIVTTTDINAADVAPEPALQTPVIAPSADFQMGAVATVSAVQNGADGNLAAAQDDILIGAPLEEQPVAPVVEPTQPENPMDDPTVDQLSNTELGDAPKNEVPDYNDPNAAAAAEAAAKTNKDEEEDDEPIVAAAPVPGSIGSAKSYADIQRAEAEKAAKVAARQAQKTMDKKNLILIIAIAAVALIGIIIGAIVLLSGNSGTKTPTSTGAIVPDQVDTSVYSTLSCKRNLAQEEYASYGAVSGIQENIFYFRDDVLDGLVTNFTYTYGSRAIAEIARDNFMRDYGVAKEGKPAEHGSASEIEEPETDDSGEENPTTKTAADMLHHYVWIDEYTVTHGMEIEAIDIVDWLASDAYSDKTYGATEDGAEAPLMEGETEDDVDVSETGEVVRNLKYYNRLQNSINYDCTIIKSN